MSRRSSILEPGVSIRAANRASRPGPHLRQRLIEGLQARWHLRKPWLCDRAVAAVKGISVPGGKWTAPGYSAVRRRSPDLRQLIERRAIAPGRGTALIAKPSQRKAKSSSQLKAGLGLQQRQQALAIMLMAPLDFAHHF